MTAGMQDFAPNDIERFFAIEDELQRLAAYLQPFFLEAPPDPDKSGLARITELIRVGRRFRRMRGNKIAGTRMRVEPQTAKATRKPNPSDRSPINVGPIRKPR